MSFLGALALVILFLARGCEGKTACALDGIANKEALEGLTSKIESGCNVILSQGAVECFVGTLWNKKSIRGPEVIGKAWASAGDGALAPIDVLWSVRGRYGELGHENHAIVDLFLPVGEVYEGCGYRKWLPGESISVVEDAGDGSVYRANVMTPDGERA